MIHYGDKKLNHPYRYRKIPHLNSIPKPIFVHFVLFWRIIPVILLQPWVSPPWPFFEKKDLGSIPQPKLTYLTIRQLCMQHQIERLKSTVFMSDLYKLQLVLPQQVGQNIYFHFYHNKNTSSEKNCCEKKI